MKADDVAFVFLAGHGMRAGGDDGDMVFVTGAVTGVADASRAGSSWKELGERCPARAGASSCFSTPATAARCRRTSSCPTMLARRSCATCGVVVLAAAKG